MKKLMITPLPSYIALDEKTVGGQLYCTDLFADGILHNAVSRFPEKGEVPVYFVDRLETAEYTDYFSDPEGYVLYIGEDRVTVAASAPAGALYGAVTLELMVRQYGKSVPCGIIADKPCWKHRGVQISYAQANVAYLSRCN